MRPTSVKHPIVQSSAWNSNELTFVFAFLLPDRKKKKDFFFNWQPICYTPKILVCLTTLPNIQKYIILRMEYGNFTL